MDSMEYFYSSIMSFSYPPAVFLDQYVFAGMYEE
jgi:hypothetical protein